MLGFYVPPTAKVKRRRDLALKSYQNDWRSPGSNSRYLVNKACSLTTTPRRRLYCTVMTMAILNRFLTNKLNRVNFICLKSKFRIVIIDYNKSYDTLFIQYIVQWLNDSTYSLLLYDIALTVVNIVPRWKI